MIEKPIALTPAELDRVESAAGDAFVMINTQYQWMPHWQRYLALIGAGALGEIRSIRASVGVDIFEQGPHALSLAMAAADAAGLPEPTWTLAGADGTFDFAGVAVPADTVATFDLGEARLTLTAGTSAPPVPGETVRAFQQQTEIVGSVGRIWVSLNQGSQLWLADCPRARTDIVGAETTTRPRPVCSPRSRGDRGPGAGSGASRPGSRWPPGRPGCCSVPSRVPRPAGGSDFPDARPRRRP